MLSSIFSFRPLTVISVLASVGLWKYPRKALHPESPFNSCCQRLTPGGFDSGQQGSQVKATSWALGNLVLLLHINSSGHCIVKVPSMDLFCRRHTYEGLALHQVHEQTVTTLVQRARGFFPPGAAQEIWAELRWAGWCWGASSPYELVRS
jgi:hypothetical protein